MIYDCFLFNDELDLLQLRLQFLDDAVDKFVIVESERTISGQLKPLHFHKNQERFKKFLPRIIHLVAPVNDLSAWDYEFFQRNYIKQALQSCADDDIIIISDADEIVNIKDIRSLPGFHTPVLAELPMYYYFLNLKSNAKFRVNMIAEWSFMKDKDWGNRNEIFPKLTNNIIIEKTVNTGWHFSYLFGTDIKKYQEKISSFSHQEYYNPYYLNEKRIERCINLGIDLFERPFMKFNRDDKSIESLLPFINESALELLLFSPSFKDRLSPGNIFFILQKKYLPRIKHKVKKIFNSKPVK